MSLFQIWVQALIVIMIMMTTLWVISIFIRNVSIVDLFWGLGFVITGWFYYFHTEGFEPRKLLLMIMVTIWGLRLSGYLTWRNAGKGEDFRYRQFRKNYGEKRYWWISFFQTFLLQGVLMWLISVPLLGAQYPLPAEQYQLAGVQFHLPGAQYSSSVGHLGFLDFAGIVLWIIGITFETGGDFQLARFKADPSNKGKVLSSGFWKYTRHPNYFGDTAVWWGFGMLSVAAGSWLPALGSLLMTALIIKVSGVALLEKSLVSDKPGYKEYIERTSAFIPWFPKKATKN
jgi:steroid 5-alpha reductase family enzyme